MNEQDFAHRIRLALNQGTHQIERPVAQRLFEARQKALAHQRVSVGGLSLAGIGHFATETLGGHARMLLATLALALGVACTYVWTHFDQAAENEEIDSALLADDLPPAAFLDKGFQAWLDRSSHSPQQ